MSDSHVDPATARIGDAERRAAVARENLSEDLRRLQAKLNPKSLARHVARSATDKGQNAAASGVGFVRDHPAPVAGAIALTGFVLLRKRLARLFGPKKKPAFASRIRPSRRARANRHSDR